MEATKESRLLVRLCAAAVVAAAALTGACAAPAEDAASATGTAITDVHATSVEKQAIGNCWLYSTTGFIEALHKGATGETLDLSESYLTYWYWFEQLTAKNACGISSVTEGGTWEIARGLVTRYGVMREADFVAEDAKGDTSTRQTDALAAVQAALKTQDSPLQKAIAGGSRAAIRRELSKLWKLTPVVTAELDRVFGADGARTLDQQARVPSASILAPRDLDVKLPRGPGRAPQAAKLAEVFGGASAWSDVQAPAWLGDDSPKARRAFEQRMQRALHDGAPLLLSWWVDPSAVDNKGTFSTRTEDEPSRDGGGHMSIVTDYEVTNVPGFGALRAGVRETRPEALRAALADAATIQFFRIKNSWGDAPDQWKDRPAAARAKAGPPGYNDLTAGYLFDVRTVSIDTSMLSAPAEGAPCGASSGPTGEHTIAGLYPILSVVLPPGY